MTNEELKKKIVDIVLNVAWEGCLGNTYHFSGGRSAANAIADALTEAGVVDKSDYVSMKETAVKYKAEVSKAENRVKDAERRAARAEIALDKAVELAYEFRTEADTLSCSSCPMFHIFDSCKERGLYQDCSKQWKEELIKQAEKELAEEGKDD